MAGSVILETTFLIDLERESKRAHDGPAHAFLQAHSSRLLYLTFTIVGELAAGTSLQRRQIWEEFISPFHILPCSRNISWEYGKIYSYLKANGQLIGGNDLWIAAAARAHQMPLVTANRRHFRRVPDLRLLPYREQSG